MNGANMSSQQSNVITSAQDPLLNADELDESQEDSNENRADPDTSGKSYVGGDFRQGSADTQGTGQSVGDADTQGGFSLDLLAENSISYNEGDDRQVQEDYLVALGLQKQEEEEASAESRKRAASPETTDQTGAKRPRLDDIESLLCSMCFQLNKKCIQCPAGHIICKPCIKFAIGQSITLDEMYLKCPAAQCDEEISIESLAPLEPNVLIELLKEHVRKKQTLASENLIQDMFDKTACPKCQSPAVLDEDNLFYQCLDKDCQVIFCRFCKACQKGAYAAVLPQFDQAHESCRILQYGGQSSPSDLSAPPVHWDIFTDEEYEAALRNNNKKQTFNSKGLFQLFYTKIMSVFPGDIPYGLMGGYMTVRLRPDTPEFQDIKAYFQKSSTKAVTDIYRVQNITCWERYIVKRKHMIKELGEDCIKEKMLYHGTSREALELIVREGFDFRKPSVTGSNYGKGIYFSDMARNSELYAKSNFMLMACVLLGRMTLGGLTYTHPPYDPTTGKMYHSCVNVLPDPSMFVIFDNDQCYPAYVIEFK